jgi:hypothetical protein
MRFETLLKVVLGVLLYPMLAVLLLATGGVMVAEQDGMGRLGFGVLFSFLLLMGLLSGRILSHNPNAHLRRLERHPPGTPEFLATCFHYFQGRARTLRFAATFALFLGLFHLVLPLVADLDAADVALHSLATLAFPLAGMWFLFRHEIAILRALRHAAGFGPEDRARALLLIAKHGFDGDGVSARIIGELEKIVIEPGWPDA